MDIKVNEDTVIVFDLDDTIYNELDYLKSAYKTIAQYLEPKAWDLLYVSMFSRYRCQLNVFDHLAKLYELDPKTLIEIYRNHSPIAIKPFDGILEVMKSIKANNGHIGLITDGRVKTQMNKLNSLGLTPYFDEIVISEAITSEKPALENYKIIEDKFPSKSYYYIADNFKKDFSTPNARAWTTIGLIDNGKNIHHKQFEFLEEDLIPRHLIFSFKDLAII